MLKSLTTKTLQFRGAGQRALPLIIMSLFCLPARAELSDTIHPFVSVGITHDDNLLRLDQDANPGVDLSDTYRSTIAGVKLEREIGRQKLTASAKVSKLDFDRFSALDYTGKDASVNLDWQLAGHLNGRLGGTYSEALASFEDFHTAARNLRTDKKVYGEANWRFHPSWQVHGAHVREEFHFDLPAYAYNNRTEETTDAGFDYIAADTSTFGLMARRMKGIYPDTVFGTTVIDNGYVQDSINLNVSWVASAVTQVTFLGGRARRRNNASSLRDESGNNGRLIVNWIPRQRLQISGSAWREFGVTEGLLVNSALSTGTNLTVTWTYSPKITVSGVIQNEKRDFRPLSGVVITSGLTDRTHNANVGVAYEPWRGVTMGLSAFANGRSGSRAAFTNSYHDKGASFNVGLKF